LLERVKLYLDFGALSGIFSLSGCRGGHLRTWVWGPDRYQGSRPSRGTRQ